MRAPSLRARLGPVRGRSRSAVFLGYHSISDDGPPFLSIAREMLERHLDVLGRSGWRAGTLDDLRGLSARLSRGQRTAFLTFDDGYVDNHAEALPRMSARGFTGFAFVLPGHVDGGAPLRWKEVAGEAEGHPEVMRSMTWSMVEELAQAGWEIGSHTLTHPRLSALSDERLAQELLDSRRRVSDRLGRCAVLAYPFGDWDDRVAAAAAAAGYEFAFSLPYGSQVRASRMSLPRVTIDHRDDEARFERKLTPAGRALLFSPLRPAVRRLTGRRPHDA